MESERTTIAIQRYLDDLAQLPGDSSAEPIIRNLLGRSEQRLHLLCARLLYRRYPRLMRPPANLQLTELLSAVTERMLMSMRETRPATARQFFHIASRHMRWELSDVAKRLDKKALAADPRPELIAQSDISESVIGPNVVHMLNVIDGLPAEQREVFDLIRVQGMTQPETAELLGVSVQIVHRRLASGIVRLAEALTDHCPQSLEDNDLAAPTS